MGGIIKKAIGYEVPPQQAQREAVKQEPKGPTRAELDDKGRKQLFTTYYSNEHNWLACPEDSKDEDGIQALINIAGDCERTYAGILKDRKIKKFYNMYLGINPAPEGFEINESKTKALIPEKFIKNPNLLKRLSICLLTNL